MKSYNQELHRQSMPFHLWLRSHFLCYGVFLAPKNIYRKMYNEYLDRYYN